MNFARFREDISMKKAHPKVGFLILKAQKSYSSTTKSFTSQVAEALVVLVYLKAMVTV
jgi:hypothetical protein